MGAVRDLYGLKKDGSEAEIETVSEGLGGEKALTQFRGKLA
jgi:hypothetical protein